MKISKLIFAYLFIFTQLTFANDYGLVRINPQITWFGFEHTAQDQGMVDEPGRASGPTDHRWAKMEQFVSSFGRTLNLDLEGRVRDRGSSLDPGYYIETGTLGTYRVNMEPVTIEVNSEPQNIFNLERYSNPIYSAYQAAGLTPYLGGAGERSGMGHIHIGARTLAESPFKIFPNLLPNLMAYLHMNPAALYGFSEAYDMGSNSNIETYHEASKQRQFMDVIEEFQDWYRNANSQQREQGLNKYLQLLRNTSLSAFSHYRYVNLERLSDQAYYEESRSRQASEYGAKTVELRIFRPYRSARHVKAAAHYLLKLMDYLSDPNLLVEMHPISTADFQFYYSGTNIHSNWEKVKREIGLVEPLADEMVMEYVNNVTQKTYQAHGLPQGAVVSAAYSRKEDKGQRIELRIPANGRVAAPVWALNGVRIPLRKISVGDRNYWVGVIHLGRYGLNRNNPQLNFVTGEEAQNARELAEGAAAAPSRSASRPAPTRSFAQVLASLNQSSTDSQARAEFRGLAAQATDSFLNENYSVSLLQQLKADSDLFVRVMAFSKLSQQPGFQMSTADLQSIVAALDNSDFSDEQLVYSQTAALLLAKYRTSDHQIQEELYQSATEDDDRAIGSLAALAYVQNGGEIDNEIREILEESASNRRVQQLLPNFEEIRARLLGTSAPACEPALGGNRTNSRRAG